MIDINDINNETFNVIQLDEHLSYKNPFYIISYKNEFYFKSSIINVKDNINISYLNNYLTALTVNKNIFKTFISLYDNYINSDNVKQNIISLINNANHTSYNISIIKPKIEKLFLEDDEHICFNIYTKDCTSTEILNSVCPLYMHEVFPKEYFIKPFYEHKQTKFYIQKEEINYDTFMKVYKRYNNLQFIFGLSNINVYSKLTGFTYIQHKYVKEIILLD